MPIVKVVTLPGNKEDYFVEVGTSIEDALQQCPHEGIVNLWNDLEANGRNNFILRLDGREPEGDPRSVFLREGSVLCVYLRPGITAGLGGLVTGGALAVGGLGGFLVSAGLFALKLGLAVGLGVLTNLLLAPKVDDVSQVPGVSESLRLTGSKNRVNPGRVIPAPYGKIRFTPPLAAFPVTVSEGDTGDQNLLLAFQHGMGAYKISDPRIGSISINNENFENPTIEDEIIPSLDELKAEISPPSDPSIPVQDTSTPSETGTGNLGPHWVTETEDDFGSDEFFNSVQIISQINTSASNSTLFRLSPTDFFSGWEIRLGTASTQPFFTLLRRISTAPFFEVIGNASWATGAIPGNQWVQVGLVWKIQGLSGSDAPVVELWVNGVKQTPTSPFAIASGKQSTLDNGFGGFRAHRLELGTEIDMTLLSVAGWRERLTAQDFIAISNSNAGDVGEPERVDLRLTHSFGANTYDAQGTLRYWYRTFNSDPTTNLKAETSLTSQISTRLLAVTPTTTSSSTPGGTVGTDDMINDVTVFTPLFETFPRTIREEQTNVRLKARFAATINDNSVLFNTEPDTTRFSVDLSFVNGLVRFNEFGERKKFSTRLFGEFRIAGSTDQWETFIDRVVSDDNVFPFSLTFSSKILSPNTYELRLTNLNSATDAGANAFTLEQGGTGDDSVSTRADVAVRAIRSEAPFIPFPCPGLRVTTLRINATKDQIDEIEEYNVLQETGVPFYAVVSGTLTEFPLGDPNDPDDPIRKNPPPEHLVAGRNPAWITLDVLRGQESRREGFPDSYFDFQEWKAWADFCDNPNDGVLTSSGTQLPLTFDGVFDLNDQSIFASANVAAAAGRASVSLVGSKFKIVVDDPSFRSVPTDVFTSRNVQDFSINTTYPDQIDSVNVDFKDFETEVLTSVNIVRPGVFNPNTFEAETVSNEFRGQQDLRNITRATLFDLLANNLRFTEYSWGTSLDSLIIQRGDRVLINHFLLGDELQTSARVVLFNTNSSDEVINIVIDEAVEVAEGTTYGVKIRHSNFSVSNLIQVTDLQSDVGAGKTLLTVTPTTITDLDVDDLLIVGPMNEITFPVIIKSIEPRADLTADVTAVDDKEEEIKQIIANEMAVITNPAIQGVIADSPVDQSTSSGTGITMPRSTITASGIPAHVQGALSLYVFRKMGIDDVTETPLGASQMTSPNNEHVLYRVDRLSTADAQEVDFWDTEITNSSRSGAAMHFRKGKVAQLINLDEDDLTIPDIDIAKPRSAVLMCVSTAGGPVVDKWLGVTFSGSEVTQANWQHTSSGTLTGEINSLSHKTGVALIQDQPVGTISGSQWNVSVSGTGIATRISMTVVEPREQG